MNRQNVIVGLDVGTSKVSCCVGTVEEGLINIIGYSQAANTGMRKGAVADIEEVVSSVTSAIETAERMAGTPLTSAFVGLGGIHITSADSKGVIAVSRADGEINQNDVERVMEAAKAIALPPNQQIIHVLPKAYTVDGQTGIKEPVGMTGIRLEAEAHVIGANSSAVKNLSKAIYQTGIEINEFVFSPLATAKLLLSKKQKEIGVVLIDFGAETTSLAIYEEGDIIAAKVIPIGSAHLTNDIAIGLRTSLEVAEKVKIKYGLAIPEKARETETINLEQFDPSEEEKPARRYVAEIIQARLIELFSIIKDELKKIGKDTMLPAGAVFSGGGSKLEGLIELAKDELKLPAQVGKVSVEFSGMVDKINDPSYATSVGLVLWGLEKGEVKEQHKINMSNVGGWLEKGKNFLRHFLP